MDLLDRDGTLSDGRCHPLHRTVPHVAGGEHAGHARLQKQRGTLQRPSSGRFSLARQVLAGGNETLLVAFDLSGQPVRARFGSNEDEEGRGRDGLRRFRGKIFEGEVFEAFRAATARNLSIQSYSDVVRGFYLSYT